MLFSAGFRVPFHGDPARVYATCFLPGFESKAVPDTEDTIRAHRGCPLLEARKLASCSAWEASLSSIKYLKHKYFKSCKSSTLSRKAPDQYSAQRQMGSRRQTKKFDEMHLALSARRLPGSQLRSSFPRAATLQRRHLIAVDRICSTEVRWLSSSASGSARSLGMSRNSRLVRVGSAPAAHRVNGVAFVVDHLTCGERAGPARDCSSR